MSDIKKDIFADLYDRVLSFFIQTQDETKLVAKNRLRTVLMQDRAGFSERAIQMLKDDVIETVSRYLEINPTRLDLSIESSETENGSETLLTFNIPVLRPKTDEEIDEAISLAKKEKIEKTQEIVGELQELVKEKAIKLADQIADDNSEEETEEEIQEPSEEEPSEEEKPKKTQNKANKKQK